jgi:hypothetical protein
LTRIIQKVIWNCCALFLLNFCAAGKNLKALAKVAFGWTDEMEKQVDAAQQTFTGITYDE